MDNETLFYICGGILAVSALVVTFAGLKLKDFPGRALPLVIVWFAVFVLGATTFAVRYSQEEQEHKAHELEAAGHRIEETEGAPHENEGGAQGGESEELEEEAEEEAEGPKEEEPVGESEGAKEASGGEAAAGATVFADNCAGCHGDDGHGGAGGPDLTTMPLAQTEAGTVKQVTNGGGGMPPFGGQLSEEEISDVAAFVVHDVVGK
ncbi:MAG TPA: c-type cytochrome [Solirubrobacterales bacterium]|nr:c-type cytochrome [Solirubrobacterales bacterium]